jgi:restriction system protein
MKDELTKWGTRVPAGFTKEQYEALVESVPEARPKQQESHQGLIPSVVHTLEERKLTKPSGKSVSVKEYVLLHLDEILEDYLGAQGDEDRQKRVIEAYSRRLITSQEHSDPEKYMYFTCFEVGHALFEFSLNIHKYRGGHPGKCASAIAGINCRVPEIVRENQSEDASELSIEEFTAKFIDPILTEDQKRLNILLSTNPNDFNYVQSLVFWEKEAIRGEEYAREEEEDRLACGGWSDQCARLYRFIDSIIEQYEAVLMRKHKQLVRRGDYDEEITEDWDRELLYFCDKVINVCSVELVRDLDRDDMLELSAAYISDLIAKRLHQSPSDRSTLSSEDEISDGVAYEAFCAELLREAGWLARTTRASGDQGADIIAEKDGRRLVVQCKFYSQPVGNKAVQEVFSAKGFETADAAAVVSNSTFTQSARQLAAVHGVLLLHHSQIAELSV